MYIFLPAVISLLPMLYDSSMFGKAFRFGSEEVMHIYFQNLKQTQAPSSKKKIINSKLFVHICRKRKKQVMDMSTQALCENLNFSYMLTFVYLQEYKMLIKLIFYIEVRKEDNVM